MNEQRSRKCVCAVARSVRATGFHFSMNSCGVIRRPIAGIHAPRKAVEFYTIELTQRANSTATASHGRLRRCNGGEQLAGDPVGRELRGNGGRLVLEKKIRPPSASSVIRGASALSCPRLPERLRCGLRGEAGLAPGVNGARTDEF
jgi:hypothetical protein